MGKGIRVNHKGAYWVCLWTIFLLGNASAITTHHRRLHHAQNPAHIQSRSHSIHNARHLRTVAWHPLFAGSHEMLVRQNELLDSLELPRIANDEELSVLEEAEELVPVEDSASLVVAPNLAENRRYCRSWTRDFVADLGEAYYREFHRPIIVTSLVRTMDQQKKLRRYNHNAAPEEGETASTHLTGVTVDILKRGMTRAQHNWLERYFLPLQQGGLIDPIEEHRQPVFHIVVFKAYSEGQPSQAPAALPDQPTPNAEN
jgi:hypothetical protein